VRCFEDPNVVHVAAGSIRCPTSRRSTPSSPLADLQTVDKQLAKYTKVAKSGGDKEAQRLVAVLEKVRAALNEVKPARSLEWSKEELVVLKPLFLLTMSRQCT